MSPLPFQTSKAALGEELYRALTEDGSEIGGLISALGVADEQSAGRVASAIEAAIHLWQRKIVKRNQVRNLFRIFSSTSLQSS